MRIQLPFTENSSLIYDCFFLRYFFEDANEYEELNKIEGTSLYNNKQFKQESLQHNSSENRTKPIMIMDLWSAIHKLEKHSNIGFKREFEVSMLIYIKGFQFGLFKRICIILCVYNLQYLRQKMNCDYINTILILNIEFFLFFKTLSTVLYLFKPNLIFANYETVGFFFKVLDRKCSWIVIKWSHCSQYITLLFYIK